MAPTTPQQGQDFGDAIRRATEGIVNNALSQAQRQIESRLSGLRAEREGLRSALANTDSRPARMSIQSRIDRLDREIAEMERALQKIDRTVVYGERATPAVVAGTQPPPPFPEDQFNPTPLVMGIMGILFVAFPLTLALVRFLWKRATHAPLPAITEEQQRRFDRLEQSVDAIAIEVERISENQRYLTKMLAEPRKQGLGVGG